MEEEEAAEMIYLLERRQQSHCLEKPSEVPSERLAASSSAAFSQFMGSSVARRLLDHESDTSLSPHNLKSIFVKQVKSIVYLLLLLFRNHFLPFGDFPKYPFSLENGFAILVVATRIDKLK